MPSTQQQQQTEGTQVSNSFSNSVNRHGVSLPPGRQSGAEYWVEVVTMEDAAPRGGAVQEKSLHVSLLEGETKPSDSKQRAACVSLEERRLHWPLEWQIRLASGLPPPPPETVGPTHIHEAVYRLFERTPSAPPGKGAET